MHVTISLLIPFIISLNKLQRLKAALHYTVGKVCECVSNTDSDNVIISKDVMVAMTELVMQQTATLAIDLELFAK